MNLFSPGFFNHIQTLPSNVVHQLDVLDNDTASLSTCLLTLIVLVTAVEVFILVLCAACSWFQLPYGEISWWDDDSNSERQDYDQETERDIQIEESLQENLWTEIADDECSICLNSFHTNDVVVSGSTTCCGHVFHKKCLHRWLKVQSTCPCCRRELLKRPVKSPKEEMPTSTISMLANDVMWSMGPWTPDTRPDYPFDALDLSFFLFWIYQTGVGILQYYTFLCKFHRPWSELRNFFGYKWFLPSWPFETTVTYWKTWSEAYKITIIRRKLSKHVRYGKQG